MKKLFTLVFCMLSFCCEIYSQVEKGELILHANKNAPKIKTRTDYTVIYEKSTKKCFKSSKRFFDMNGCDTLLVCYSITNGKIFTKFRYKYNSKNKVVEKIEMSLNPFRNKKNNESDDFNIDAITEYEYDENNNSIKCISRDNELKIIRVDKSRYNYYPNGKISEIEYLNENNVVDTRLKYTYDSAGNITTQVYYNSTNNQFVKTEFVYNNKGQKIKTIYYNRNESVRETENFIYDSKGRKVEKYIINPDSSVVSKFIYSYNSNDINIKTIRTENRAILDCDRIVTTYDVYGNLKRIKRYDENGKILREYKYYYTYYR